jgi:PPOX class probable F420-dependent enzyme
MSQLIDPGTEFGARANARLNEEGIAWLVTVGSSGTPQPTPVWFAWDGTTFLVYSLPGQAKLRNIERNGGVAIHLDSRSSGDDIVILTGTAVVDQTAPLLDKNETYVSKYREEMQRLGLGTPEEMARTYLVAIRITPSKIRGF